MDLLWLKTCLHTLLDYSYLRVLFDCHRPVAPPWPISTKHLLQLFHTHPLPLPFILTTHFHFQDSEVQRGSQTFCATTYSTSLSQPSHFLLLLCFRGRQLDRLSISNRKKEKNRIPPQPPFRFGICALGKSHLKVNITHMEDSSNAQVRPRRLSKPRTIRSSSNLLCEQLTTPSSPHKSPDQDYFGRDAVIMNSHGERRSRSKSRGRIRAYLYGSSHHDVTQCSSDDEEAQTGIAGAARDVRKRASRTYSTTTLFQSAKVSTTRLSNSSSSGLLSLRSTESQNLDSEDTIMLAEQIKHRAYHDNLAAENHVSTPVDEDRHVESMMAPLRRKSLYTPGIATRDPSDILQKPSKPSTDHDYYYDPTRPETSPLSHLAALDVGEDGRSTPCDLHYSQLGGLQLGTLRVMNGASSPVPGDQPSNRSPTSESKTHDEYYTASEGSVTGDADHATPLRGGSPLKYESKFETSMRSDNRVPTSPSRTLSFERETSNGSFPFPRETSGQAAHLETEVTDESARSGKRKTSDVVRLEEGPLNESSQTLISFSSQNESRDEVERFEEATSKGSFRLTKAQSKTCRVNGRTPNEPLFSKGKTPDELVDLEREELIESAPFKMRSSKARPGESMTPNEYFCTRETSSNDASDIADEYIAELDGGPFAYPSLEDKRHMVTKPQDDAGAIRASFPNNAGVQHAGNDSGSREDALRKLTVNAVGPSTWRPDHLSVTTSQPSKYSASSEIVQADSGYCSHASLTGTPTQRVGFLSGGNQLPCTKVSASNRPLAAETVRSSAQSSFHLPIRKLQKQRPKSQPPPISFISVKQCHELTDVPIPRVPSIIAARHADRLRQFPLLEHTFQSAQHTTADMIWSPTQPHYELIQSPSPANYLQAASAPLSSLPTASSKHHANPIIGEDEWGSPDLVRSPSWSEFGGGRRRKEQKKLAKEEKQLEKRRQKEKKEDEKQRRARSRSASRTRLSSQRDPLVTIADFGTVTESLGNSPYDIATAMATPPNTSLVSSNWHPHQMSTSMPRPKSMFGRDEVAATDFPGARNRNRSHSFGRTSAGQAVRISTSCSSHDTHANGDSGTRSRAFGTSSALPSLSDINLASPNPVSSTRSEPAPKTDKLLDILPGTVQRILGDPYRDFCEGRPHSLFVDAPSVPALAAVDLRTHDMDWARDRQRSQSFSVAKAETFDDRVMMSGKSMGLHSDDTPPVPALPSIQQVKQREAEIVRSRPHSMLIDQREATTHPSEQGTSVTSRKKKGSTVVPDLWSNGSLERKSPKTVEKTTQASNRSIRESDEALPAKDTFWESQSYAWSQRRKSAGEGLLKNKVQDIFDDQEAANRAPLYGNSRKPPSRSRAFTFGTCQSFTSTPSHLGPFPNPLASHRQLTAQQSTCPFNTEVHHESSQLPISTPSHAQIPSFQIPRKRIGSGPSILRTDSAIGSGHPEGIPV